MHIFWARLASFGHLGLNFDIMGKIKKIACIINWKDLQYRHRKSMNVHPVAQPFHSGISKF